MADDPGLVLERAGAFLASDPVRHNLILTLLHGRRAHPQPGRYWIAQSDGHVTGVAFQSPLDFLATITPMDDATVEAVVDAAVASDVRLPGVNGDAASAARFAGQWTERHKSGATPIDGQRIYEVADVQPPANVPGRIRQAVDSDRDRLVSWSQGFEAETGGAVGDADTVARRVAAGQFWVWEHGDALAMAARTEAVAGVARVQAVYTPPEHRNRGYASACVAHLSEATLQSGTRCILFTELANPTSNSIYRQIGYRAVTEILRYRFG